MYRTAVRTATLSMLIFASTTKAGQLPADMWANDNKYGGRPSITAGPNGVSVVLPESAIVRAGGGAVTDLAKQLLERYAPGICSGVFDFQSAHKALTVGVAVLSQSHAVPGGNLYVVGRETSVTFDYTPGRRVTCVSQEPPLS
jgi:hypothetical protein